MKHIKKYVAVILSVLIMLAVSGCNNDIGGIGAIKIVGAADIQLPLNTKNYDWSKGVSVSGGNFTLNINSSQVDFSRVGKYEVEYSVQAGVNIIKEKINVEVVVATQQSIARSDIKLLEELQGEQATPAQIALINHVAYLRANNYAYITGYKDFFDEDMEDEDIQSIFLQVLTPLDITFIRLYFNMWNELLDSEELPEEIDTDVISFGLILGRQLSSAEKEAVPMYKTIEQSYNQAKTAGDPNFEEAESEDFERVLGRKLNSNENNAIKNYMNLMYEYQYKTALVIIERGINRKLSYDDINSTIAFKKILFRIEEYMPVTVEEFEQFFEVELTASQAEQFDNFINLYYEVILADEAETIRNMWGRDYEENEKAYLLEYLKIKHAYENKRDSAYPSFDDANLLNVEQLLERYFTDTQKNSVYYVKGMALAADFNTSLGEEEELAEEEINALPVVLALKDMYEYNAQEEAPDFDDAADEDIESVIGTLTEEQKTALNKYRDIRSRTMQTN